MCLTISRLNFYSFFTLFTSTLSLAVLTRIRLSAMRFNYVEGDFMSSLYILLTLVFFAATVALVYACERLRGQS